MLEAFLASGQGDEQDRKGDFPDMRHFVNSRLIESRFA